MYDDDRSLSPPTFGLLEVIAYSKLIEMSSPAGGKFQWLNLCYHSGRERQCATFRLINWRLTARSCLGNILASFRWNRLLPNSLIQREIKFSNFIVGLAECKVNSIDSYHPTLRIALAQQARR